MYPDPTVQFGAQLNNNASDVKSNLHFSAQINIGRIKVYLYSNNAKKL